MIKHYFSKVAFVFFGILAFSLGAISVFAYSKSGYRWAGTSVNYYVSNVFAASFRTAFQAADASWDAAGSKFRFYYGGTTARNPNAFAYSLDGHSDVGYFNNGNTGIIALTVGGVTSQNGSTISERDTTLNIYYGFTTIGVAGSYDVQNIMTHEFGHWLKLLDVYSGVGPTWCSFSWESTMCGSVFPGGTNRRSLEGDDKDGAKAIYGI